MKIKSHDEEEEDNVESDIDLNLSIVDLIDKKTRILLDISAKRKIQAHLSHTNPKHVVVVYPFGHILLQDFSRLDQYNWINDVIINCYLYLLTARNHRRRLAVQEGTMTSSLRCFFLSTFFWTQLNCKEKKIKKTSNDCIVALQNPRYLYIFVFR